MLNALKKIFYNRMELDDDYDMLDVLAYNCTNLKENLSDVSPEEHKLVLESYIQKADSTFKSISEFKEDLDWFNVTEPLTFSESLLGKIVVLDFFTYCCINCMHILPDLKKLEELHTVEDGLVIIGVHSAKFDNEKDSANILSAVQRYDITHPVVNDNFSSMWIDLKIKCWPTLVILGPRANPLFIIMGEGHLDLLQKYVSAAIDFYGKQNALKRTSLPLNPSTDLIMSSNLKFPGKICCSKGEANTDSAEIFAVSDSGNHRILIINAFGDVLQKIGGKTSGFIDGDFKTARFNAPQGSSFLSDNILFVADTGNNAIRRIDLKTHSVSTVVGTGKQGNDRVGGKIGLNQELSSPWDVACYKTRDMDMSFHMDESSVPEKDVVLIAMAGTHQIWGLFLDDVIWWKFKKFPAMSCAAIVGNGQEENRNNSYPQNASFAQPSGLTIDASTKTLYVADSESSCVRKVSLTDGKVLPVVGGDRNPLNLFAFGDVDGKQITAKLQHPLAVAFSPSENAVYVADTYNHKIKKITSDNSGISSVATCTISGAYGASILFNEPGGLCLNSTGELLYVADTNNHCIEVINLKNMTTKSLKLNFGVSCNITIAPDHSVVLGNLKIKSAGGKVKLSIGINMQEGVKLTEDAPQVWSVYLPTELYFVDKQNGNIKPGSKVEIDITVPKKSSSESESINLFLKLNLCLNSHCFSKIYCINIPLVFDDAGLDCIIEDATIIVSEQSISI